MQCSTNIGKINLSTSRSSLVQKTSGISQNNPNGPKGLRSKQNASFNEYLSPTKSTENFDFKHVSKRELEAVVKRVRRANQRQRDEEEWKCFLKLKQDLSFVEDDGRNLENKQSSDESASCKDCGLIELPSHSHFSRHQGSPRDEEAVPESSVYPSANDSVAGLNESHLYQLGGGLTKRLQDLLATVNKMTSLLLSPCLQSQYEDEDVDRTIKRSQEFDAMFARNHLYEIQRLLKDTKQMTTTKSNNTADLESKISAALKSVTQALQVYTRHVSKGSRIKYQQVVPIFQSISTTLGYIEHLTGQRMYSMRKEIEVACSYMRQVLLEMSATETKSVSSVSRASVVRTQPRHRHKPSADLSMYSRRHRPDWRRKSATLARARFGPPTTKKSNRVSTAVKESVFENPKNDFSDGNASIEVVGCKINDKSHTQSKDLSNLKEGPYRNATRAVPEERVTTMMEMIPLEPLEDLCIDDNTFEALKLLNGPSAKVPLKKGDNIVDQGPSSANGTAVHHNKRTRPTSARSTSKETSNVKLVYMIETESRSKPVTILKGEEKQIVQEDNRRVLTLDEKIKDEALHFHQEMIEYQKSSSIYKDNKALGIVDRLATNILSEMISDFQNKEMDQVVQLLYKLEFE